MESTSCSTASETEAEADGSFSVGDVTFVSNVSYKFVTSGRSYAYAINDRLDTNNDGTYSTGAIVELGEKLYQGDLTKEEDKDDFGRPADIWEYQAKEVGTFPNEADYTFTAKVTSKALYNEIGKTAAENYAMNVYFNGNLVEDYGKGDLARNKADDDADFVYKETGDEKLTGNGVITEVFVDGTNEVVNVAIMEQYAAEVLTVDSEDGTITLSDLSDDGPVVASDEFEATGFAEDDIVIYTFANDKIQSVYAAEEMSGDVTTVRTETKTNTDGENVAEGDGDYFIVDGTTYNYNKTMEPNEKLQTENVNNGVVAYLDAQGYVAYIDESAITYDYAYVLSMGTDGDQYDEDDLKGRTVYARLVLTDGTIIKVETDEKGTALNNHIVSYSKDKNNVYSLTDRSDVAIADAKGENLEIQNGVASMTINGRYTANANTVFIVADTDKDSYEDYNFSVYTGVKNVPDIDGLDTTKAVVAAKDSSNVAKVVYIEDADVAGTGNVIFVRADANPKYVKDSETGNYFELNVYMDGSASTIKVKEGTSAAKSLVTGNDMKDGVSLGNDRYLVALKSITENADGLVTSARLYDEYTNTTGDGFIKGVGMEKAKDDAVLLENITQWTGEVIGNKDENGNYSLAYAWDEEVIVAQYNDKSSKNQFSTSRISAIKDDANDKYVAVLDGDVIVGICTVYVEDGEPGAIEGENITTKVNDNATLTVDSKDAKADYIRMNANGDGTYRFQVTLPDDGKTYGQVKYTETVYVNNSSSYETTKEVTKTIPANKMIEGTIRVDIDTGDKVEVRITNVSLIETVPTAEQVTLTLKGNLKDADGVWVDGKNIIDKKTADIDGNISFTVNKNAEVTIVDDNIKKGTYVLNGKNVTIDTEKRWTMTLTENTVLDNAPSVAAQVFAVTTHNGVAAKYTDADGKEQMIAANSTTYVPKNTTITITSVGEGSKVIRTNTAGVGNATYQYDVDSTMTIGQDYDLYSAAQVKFNAGKVMIGATEIASMDYVAIGVDLTVTPSGTGAASVASVDGVSKVSDVNVAVDGYTMTKDNIQFYTAWQVTLNNVTAKVGNEVVNDGDYVVNGQTVTAEVVSGTGTDVVTLDGKAGTEYTGAAIAGDLNLAAATKVTVTAKVKSLTYEGKNGPVTLAEENATSVYVLADTKLTATVAVGETVKVTGADAEKEGNTATFTVGTSAISVDEA